MADEVEVILQKLSEKAEVRFLSGAFRGFDEERRALVDFSGGRVPAYVLSGLAPALNEQVWVEIANGVAYIHGPTVPRPDEGTVISAAVGTAKLNTVTGLVTAIYDDGLLILDPGDVVRLTWGPSGAWVLGVVVDAVPAVVPLPPPGGSGRQSREFSAVDSGSYQSGYGWRTNEVWSSSSNIGAWFYGTQIADTIPNTAGIVSAQIFLPAPTRLTGAMPFGRHGATSKPGGPVSFDGLSTLPGTSGWVDIPTALIDHLKSNPGGLGFDYGGYNIWPGTQRDGQSGKVRVVYDA